MKKIRQKLSICLILSLGLFSSVLVQAESKSLLLNYQEWSSLSNEDQIVYLRNLQKIMADIDQSSEFFASDKTSSGPSRSPAAVKDAIKSATPEQYATVAENYLQESNELMDQAQGEKNLEKKYALLKTATELNKSTRYGLQLITDEKLAKATHRKWNLNLERLVADSQNVKGTFNEGDTLTLPKQVKSIVRLDSDLYQLAKYQGNKESPEFKEALANNTSSPIDFKIAKEKFKLAVTQLPKENKSGEFFRCMYAGFILKENCQAPSLLPKDVMLPGLNPEKFTCDKSQVLCNPLLFGGAAACPADASSNKDVAKKCLAEMTGFCIPKSSSATQNCLEQASKSPDNLKNTALIIHQHPDAWNDYTNSFRALCDESKIEFNNFTKKKGKTSRQNQERVIEDVTKTCGQASLRLLELKSKMKVDLKNVSKEKIDSLDKITTERLENKLKESESIKGSK